MNLKYLIATVVLFISTVATQAQRVKRKGVTPIDVTKNKQSQQVASFKLEQFAGKWQEVGRTKINGKGAVDMKDSIMINFHDGDKVSSREGNQQTETGTAQIYSDNTIAIGADTYTIKSVNDNTMMLSDDEFVHTFNKVDHFSFEAVNNKPVAQDMFDKAIEFKLDDIMGNWMVYKKQAKPGAVKDPTVFVRYLKITEKVNETTARGEITVYKTTEAEALQCTISIYKTGMQIITDKYKWYLPVYKATKDELVFGNAELMLNFCKPM